MSSGLDAVFAKSEPQVRAIYDAVVRAVQRFGPVEAEPKKTSVHLTAGSAFAGAHPRKAALLLNIRTDKPIRSARIRKTEQVSKNRCHNELLLNSKADVDKELVGWLQQAYDLGRT